MDKDNCLVKVQGEDGKTFDMLILKEFDYKEKRYAVLSEIDACHCNEECHCEEQDCHCNEDCECEEQDCHCNEECHCEEQDCHCNEECHCGCHGGCHHEDEPILCLLEITKDDSGNEIFKSIDNEKLFNELVEEADKILYED